MSVDLTNRTHGKPGTYTAGCRCDECRKAWSTYQLTNRSQRAYRIAIQRAAALMQEQAPDLWRSIYEDAKAEIGGAA